MLLKLTIAELRKSWKLYHEAVHTGMVPCDANPGDDCSVEVFLNWLAANRPDPKKWANERRLERGG